jgi:thioredoxin
MKMKKWLCLLCALLAVTFITACSKYTTYEEVSFDTVMKMLDEKQSFILFIGSSSCSHCATYEPKLNSVIKEYQVKVYFIDVSKLSDTENSKLNAKISYGNATPMTVFIENGKEKSSYNRIRGDQDRDVIVSMFQKNGYIEE